MRNSTFAALARDRAEREGTRVNQPLPMVKDTLPMATLRVPALSLAQAESAITTTAVIRVGGPPTAPANTPTQEPLRLRKSAVAGAAFLAALLILGTFLGVRGHQASQSVAPAPTHVAVAATPTAVQQASLTREQSAHELSRQSSGADMAAVMPEIIELGDLPDAPPPKVTAPTRRHKRPTTVWGSIKGFFSSKHG
jgi:hypothetical protein